METEQIRERMRDIKKKMLTIEWDKEKLKTMSRDHIYKQLKEEYKELKEKLET